MPLKSHPGATGSGKPYPAGSLPRHREVDCRGIAPRSPACKAGVLLLDQQPMKRSKERMAGMGVEPTGTGLSVRRIFRFAYPAGWGSASGRSRTAKARGRVGYGHRGSPMPSRRMSARKITPIARVGCGPTRHEGLSPDAPPVRVPCRIDRAPSMGFEPTTSTVTGWRALPLLREGDASASSRPRKKPGGRETPGRAEPAKVASAGHHHRGASSSRYAKGSPRRLARQRRARWFVSIVIVPLASPGASLDLTRPVAAPLLPS